MGEVLELKQRSDIVIGWLDQYRSDKTYRSYKNSITGFFNCDVENITSWKVKSVKFNDVVKYLKGLFTEGKSDNTIRNRKAGLSSFFEYCIDMNVISENPCNNRSVKRLMKLNVTKGEEIGIALSKDEIRELLEKIDNRYERIMIEIAVKTGVRVSELIEMKFSDIIEKNECHWVRVVGKGDKIRYIAIGEELLEKIKEYMRCYRVKDRLFEVGARQVDRVLKKWDGRLSCHDLRRTFITNLIKNGASINVVQQLAGHEKLSTTQRYFKEYERFDSKIVGYIDW